MPYKDKDVGNVKRQEHRRKNAEAHNAKVREYKAKKRETINTQALARYHANREQILAEASARKKQRYGTDPEYREKILATNRARYVPKERKARVCQTPEEKEARRGAWYEVNKDKILAQQKIRYQEKKTEILAKHKEWRSDNPNKLREYSLQRRALENNAHGHASTFQIQARVEYFGGICSYCGDPYKHLDHAIPLARGGTNWPANLRPACAQCNLSKGTKTVVEFVVP